MSSQGARRWTRPLLYSGALLLCVLLAQPLLAMAQEDVQSMRARIGVGLFRTMLASDLDLGSKISANGQLKLLLFHHGNANAAEKTAGDLRQSGRGGELGRIRDWPIDAVTASDLDAIGTEPPAAIYLVEALPDAELAALVAYGVKHRIVVFSPVEGDVEKGVLGGLHIGVRALPYVNTQTLEQSQLRLKELFLKVAKPYG